MAGRTLTPETLNSLMRLLNVPQRSSVALRTTSMLAICCFLLSCQSGKDSGYNAPVDEGTFGFDLAFLSQYDDVVLLKQEDAQIIVSPKYQGKVFTSTAEGEAGKSFGWVNYKTFTTTPNEHMNAFGGENRFWLGPEGNAYSLFFKPGSEMTFDNWFTPPSIDIEPWNVINKDNRSVTLSKSMELLNYAGTTLDIDVTRTINILTEQQIQNELAVTLGSEVHVVGYSTDNTINNSGNDAWTRETGAPCIWILDMFVSSPGTVIVVPYQRGESVITSNYFGEIQPDRLRILDSLILFRADGQSRGKIGVSPKGAKHFAGSYDFDRNVLTIVTYDLDPNAVYLNQEWTTDKDPFAGDAVNAYNDGPLEDGSIMGPFYELESVSPAAFLKPGETLSHRHSVFHLTGDRNALKSIFSKKFGPIEAVEAFVKN